MAVNTLLGEEDDTSGANDPLRAAGITFVSLSLMVVVVLAMPFVRDWLQGTGVLPPAVMPSEWIKWCSFALGIATAFVFGSYLFAKFTKDKVKAFCDRIEERQADKAASILSKQQQAFATIMAILKKAWSGEKLTAEDRKAYFRAAFTNISLNPFKRSPYVDVSLHFLFQAVPGKVYGLLAYIFFMLKICCDLALLYLA